MSRPAFAAGLALLAAGSARAQDLSAVPDFGRVVLGGIAFRRIPAGAFVRGLTAEQKTALEKERLFSKLYADEMPARTVRITRPFLIGECEVTQAQWKAFKESRAAFPGDDLPVEKVSWTDAKAFCAFLSQKVGGTFRLPTEAEWEYAARAGSSGLYAPTAAGPISRERVGEIGWFFGNASGRTHPVAQKTPSPWGLYDTAGNVWEWCEDSYAANYYGRGGAGEAIDPLCRDPAATERVVRGGGWALDARHLRVGLRGGQLPAVASPHIGFRLVREL